MMERRTLLPLLAVLLTLAGALRIVLTYSVFSQAWDEPAHIACGLEWWTSGATTCDPANPPLARMVVAAPLYWRGFRVPAGENEIVRGNAILHANGRYRENLALTRGGTLVFFFLGAWVVYRLGSRLFGGAVAVLGVGLYSSLPMVLHVASLAYTDMAVTGCFALFVYRGVVWLGQRTFANSVWVGVAAGLAIGAKYSAIPYVVALIAAAGLIFLVKGQAGRLTPQALVPVVSCLFVLWGVFHFAITPISGLTGRHPELDRLVRPGTAFSSVLYKAVETPLPLANLGPGLAAIAQFNRDFKSEAEPYYFLGQVRTSGHWYYFPMVLLCLFPFAFMAAALGGMLGVKPWTPDRCIVVAAPLCILLVNMMSNLSFAPRHIAPVCPFLCVLAGAFLVRLWNETRFPLPAKAAAVGLLAAQVIPSAAAHPDYHAYSNLVQRLLPPVSLFDMGKDVSRLSGDLKARGVPRLSIALEGSNDLARMDLPLFDPLVPYRYTTGWIAISEHRLKIHASHAPPYDGFAWLEKHRPVARIGTSIRLYYIGKEAQP
jgi:4-amino-4-deoxy-L-arabinose transferase-like glycosyltransferase